MTPAKKPKLAFKPRRMWRSCRQGTIHASKKEASRLVAYWNVRPVLVLPADPESVRALTEKLAAIIAETSGVPLADSTPGRAAFCIQEAEQYMTALGFKPKARK